MQEQQQILFVQIRILRMASERFCLTLKATAELFKQFDVNILLVSLTRKINYLVFRFQQFFSHLQ